MRFFLHVDETMIGWLSMKTYIVYDGNGTEVGYIKAANHNAAEKKAKKKFDIRAFVSYTEL